MLRAIGVTVALAALALTFVPTDASAQRGFRAGGPVGFRAGPAMGFRGPAMGFRAAGPGFRAAGPGFRGPAFRAAGPGFRPGGPGFRRWAGPGPRYGRGFYRRGFYPYAALGIPLAAYGAYSYYNSYGDDCVQPRTVLTQWGYRTQWVNVCYDYY